MKVLFDTNVLVSAMLPDHLHHGNSHHWLNAAKLGTIQAVVAGHTLLELYAVLTRLPREPRISPQLAWQLITENVCSHATIDVLTSEDYLKLLGDLAQQFVIGGAAYDALIATSAERTGADLLLTWNVKHFREVWSNRADRVISPEDRLPP